MNKRESREEVHLQFDEDEQKQFNLCHSVDYFGGLKHEILKDVSRLKKWLRKNLKLKSYIIISTSCPANKSWNCENSTKDIITSFWL